MIRNIESSRNEAPPSLGIAAISTFQPPWQLPNEWFENIARKFVNHTGILKRRVSLEDEVTLAVHAAENLIRDTGCQMQKCAGIVFTSPSFVPLPLARKYMDEARAQEEELDRAADQFVRRMQLHPRQVVAVNTYCAGYASALAIVLDALNPTIDLRPDEFILVLTASRISRITDYSCRQSSALFGDLATATMVTRLDCDRYPTHFELLDAHVQETSTNRPFFQFALRQQVLVPTTDGGQSFESERIVFSLDGMGIADAAPRAMASAASEMLNETGMRPENIQYIVPHQAGSGIVRLAEMKLRDAGFTGTVVNGMTKEVGNVSSGSVPYTLNQLWHQLDGNILCPVASVGPPGEPAVAQGCIALRSTPIHRAKAA